jgi:dTDP-4-amino-4,6-dideoxygalactose transaminase
LPIYPSLSLDDQNYIIKAIKEFLQRLSTAA